MPTWCIMGSDSRGVAESVMRRLGPLPRRALLFNSTAGLSQGAVRQFLASSPRGPVGADNDVKRPGVNLQASAVVERRDWYRITNMAGGEAVVDIFDEIGFWGVNAASFQRDLAQVTASEITVNLSSPGGEIFEGIAIYNALRSHPANVTVRVSALAASIASVIAQAGDRIVMLSGSQMMIHEGSGLCMGTAADMAQMAELLDRQSDNIAAIYAERAGGTTAEWRDRMRAETWYTAQEAVDAGLADEVDVLPPRKGEPAEPTARWDLSLFRYAGREQAPSPAFAAGPLASAGPAVPIAADLLPEPETDGAELRASAEAALQPELEPAMTLELRGEHRPELLDLTPHVAGEPQPAPDPWAAATAHLTQPAPNPWAGLVAHLTSPAATSTHA